MPSLTLKVDFEDEDIEKINKTGFTIEQFIGKAIGDSLEKLKTPEPEVKQP